MYIYMKHLLKFYLHFNFMIMYIKKINAQVLYLKRGQARKPTPQHGHQTSLLIH